MSWIQRFIKFILPAGAFAAVQEGTKLWLAECQCGYKYDLWEAGNIRYKASGEPRQLMYCPSCGKNTMHVIRKKTAVEKQEIM